MGRNGRKKTFDIKGTLEPVKHKAVQAKVRRAVVRRKVACKICDAVFARPEGFYKHLEKKHPPALYADRKNMYRLVYTSSEV